MRQGFTLIETLVAIFVFTLLMGAVGGLVVTAYNNYRYLWDQIRAVSEARLGLRRMVREAREAQIGADGSNPVSKADDHEFIFHSNVDNDDEVEQVRYFLSTGGSSGSDTDLCASYGTGVDCYVSFSNFTTGEVTSVEAVLSTEGDLGWWLEFADVYADGIKLGRLCQGGTCSDCAGAWEGTDTFDVTEYAQDGSVEFRFDPTGWVNPFCDWQEPGHSLLGQVQLSWEQESSGEVGELTREVRNPVGSPPQYPKDSDSSRVIAHYVRNSLPTFEYFDESGQKIDKQVDRLRDTRFARIFLEVDVYPDRAPAAFELVSKVFLRNLDPIYEQ